MELPKRVAGARPEPQSVPQHLLCNSCSKPLFNGFQTPHGCRLCQSCVTDLLPANERRRCPGNTEACRDETDPEIQVSQATCFADMATRRELARLQVLCPNSHAGCTAVQAWAQVDAHLESCHFQTLTCELCTRHIMKKDLHQHVNKECHQRKTKCEHCSQLVPFCDITSKHRNLQSDVCCVAFSAHCPHCGDRSRKLDRRAYMLHLSECPESPVDCKYSHLGCSARVSRSQLPEHYRSCSDLHLELMDAKLRQVALAPQSNSTALPPSPSPDVSALKRKVDVINEYFKRMQVSVANWAHTMLEFEQMAERFGGVAQMRESLQRMSDRVRQLDGQQRTSGGGGRVDPDFACPATPIRSDSTSEKLQLQRGLTGIANRLLTLENTSYDGRLTWKVTNLPARGASGSVFSVPFFLRKYGPMFAVRLFPGGNESGAGSHVSVYVVNIKHEFDDLPGWPIIADVTIRLFCVADRRLDAVKTVKMDTTGFPQPVSKDDYSVCVGEPRLVPLGDFYGKYVREGSCFLEVDMAELKSDGSLRRKLATRRN